MKRPSVMPGESIADRFAKELAEKEREKVEKDKIEKESEERVRGSSMQRKAQGLASLLMKMPMPGAAPPSSATKSSGGGDHDEHDEPEDDTMPPVSSLTDPDKTGMLEKEGFSAFGSHWRHRLCVLKGDNLYWLKDKSDKFPTGRLRVSDAVSITISPVEQAQIDITMPEKVWCFRAVTSDDAQSWLKAMKMQKVVKGGERKAAAAAASSLNKESKDSKDSSGPSAEELERALKMGAVFVKFKRKAGKTRTIWASSALDEVFWGDERRNVKGSLKVSDITAITEICPGASKQEYSITVVTSDRTLELEAMSKEQKDLWKAAFHHLQVRLFESTNLS